MKTISFIFPSPGVNPAGGYKVAYEYANRLVADGFQVNIVYAGSIFWSQKTLYYKITNCVRYIQRWIKGYSCRKWFALDKRVKEVFAFSLNYRHVPHSDIYIATSPYVAMYVKDYPVDARNKYYFIQGYENWGGITDAILHSTYHYDLQKIVVSNWLGNILKKERISYNIVFNGFDFDYYKMYLPYEDKDKYKIAMIYSPIENKGARYGLEALLIAKQKYPQLRGILFGSDKAPNNLPEWMDYYCCPNQKLQNRIYNESAIFLATSIMEGWGLPVGEAMICGAAVICTDNQGYREMAIDKENALICPIKDSQSLANSIIKLIEDDNLRYRIAKKGHESIQRFNINTSYSKLKGILSL